MLTAKENELLTRVGPGTMMGELVRRYWMPALTSDELRRPNGDPVRFRLAGEDLIAWRDAAGRVGVFDEHCMHRGASLALGRCEGDGLRCLYHGWKYATDGTILETPNFDRSTVRDKLRAPVHPVREAGGLIWTYLGPAEKEPPFPHYKFMDHSGDHLGVYHSTFDCSFVQVLEGSLDPTHVHILHQDTMGTGYEKRADASAKRTQAQYTGGIEADSFETHDNAPDTEVLDTTFGCDGAFIFDATADGRPTKFGRVYSWVMPFMKVSPSFFLSVPIDDEHTSFFAVWSDPTGSWDAATRDRFVADKAGPASEYEHGHYRWGPAERWGQDRASMGDRFSGISGIMPEDIAMAVSMGPVVDRTRENLVPADQLVIRMRRRLLQAARDLANGIEPPMLTSEEAHLLGGDAGRLLPDPRRWHEVIVPGHAGFRLHREAEA
jgi:phenylpropionate dioxygenase-like ring-hydroxylating dioxygenase large terminal subunit